MDIASIISKKLEDAILEALIKAVQNLSIEIDEEELLKRLRDSKEQYQRGYEGREQEIVRCKDCKYWDADEHECNIKIGWCACDADWFCADGKREQNG